MGFHSFHFQTFALAVECQTLSWEPPIVPPCLCPGTQSSEEGRAGADSRELALECGARAQAILSTSSHTPVPYQHVRHMDWLLGCLWEC